MKLPHPIPDATLPGQESVWSYPRPSVAQPVRDHLRVMLDGRVLAETSEGVRTIELSHPPSFYFPPQDVDRSMLVATGRSSFCEWKGDARYFDVLAGGRRIANAAWSYPAPSASFGIIRDFIAFYPGLMDECTVNGEIAVPQPGRFYGGWITFKVAGPFKGPPGTEYW
jgi:uncharacterized protein (DUF427 family)